MPGFGFFGKKKKWDEKIKHDDNKIKLEHQDKLSNIKQKYDEKQKKSDKTQKKLENEMYSMQLKKDWKLQKESMKGAVKDEKRDKRIQKIDEKIRQKTKQAIAKNIKDINKIAAKQDNPSNDLGIIGLNRVTSEVREILTKAGITQKLLNNRKVSRFVRTFLHKHGYPIKSMPPDEASQARMEGVIYTILYERKILSKNVDTGSDDDDDYD